MSPQIPEIKPSARVLAVEQSSNVATETNEALGEASLKLEEQIKRAGSDANFANAQTAGAIAEIKKQLTETGVTETIEEASDLASIYRTLFPKEAEKLLSGVAVDPRVLVADILNTSDASLFEMKPGAITNALRVAREAQTEEII